MKLAFLLLLFGLSEAYKIVILAPAISNSQLGVNKRVAEGLADAGHDVTLVLLRYMEGLEEHVQISSKVRVHPVNATIGKHKEEFEKMQAPLVFNEVPIWDGRMWNLMNQLMSMLSEGCRQTLRNKEFMQWLKNEKFDVAFPHMYSLCAVGLVKHAEIPTWVWLNSGAIMDYVASLVGVPLIPSYVPPMVMEATDEMSFYERTKSFIGHGLMKFVWSRGIPATETAIFREELDPNFPHLLDIAAECPLVMAMSNIIYEMPRPTLAKVVNIGGIGIQFKDAKPLTGEFAKIAEAAKGMIVFSFGSVAAAHEMPEKMKHEFIEGFKEFPDIHILMRYEGHDLDDIKPANLHLSKWLPQQDLLAHNKTIAFITHGGYNSVQEALAAGVPLITIPLFGDQSKNAMTTRKHGISVHLPKSKITKENVVAAIREIVDNPKYSKKVKRMSAMVKKAPVSPEHLLVRWTEFVAEFKTLENLVPAGQKLNFFQYHSIDVMAFLFFILFTVLYIVYRVIKGLICCVYRRLVPKKVKND